MAYSNNGGIFAGVSAGLLSTYSTLANASGTSGVTLSSIASAQTNTSLSGHLNPTFASYIQSNFSSLDKDGDGVLSTSELSNFTNTINSTGMTAAQLSQLGSACGLSGETLNQVLEHFAQIDANGDGKVTSAEISAFKLKSAMENKKTEFANKAATNMSVFYSDDNASANANSSSLVAFKYMNTGNNNNSNSSS